MLFEDSFEQIQKTLDRAQLQRDLLLQIQGRQKTQNYALSDWNIHLRGS